MFNLLKKKLVNKYPFFGKWIHYKFNLEWEDNEKDHELGASYDYDDSDLLEDGDWYKIVKSILTEREFFEIQKGKFLETMGCTGYGTLNADELIEYKKFGVIKNYSDRFTNKNSGVTKNGAKISRVFESIRKLHGLVDEKDWPWDRDSFTWNKYYANIPVNIYGKGKNWLKENNFNYQKLRNAGHEEIKRGLRKSPVGVGVDAWYARNGVYYSVNRANHWTLIIKQNWGQNYIILDSYPPYIKVLDWNFKFSFPRIFFINKKEDKWNMEKINKLRNEGYDYIIRGDKNGEFSKLTDNGLIYIPKIQDIADEIAEDLKLSPEKTNLMLKYLTQEKKLKWLTEKGYYELKK